jgi:hypothetical protein
MAVSAYHIFFKKAESAEEIPQKDAFEKPTENPSVPINIDDPNFDKLRVVHVDSSRSEEYLSPVYKGLIVLRFVLFNDGNKDMEINYIKVEAKHGDFPQFEENINTKPLSSTKTVKTKPLFTIEISENPINAYYYYTLEQTIVCPVGKHLVIPIVFYQQKNNQYILPDSHIEFTLQFISKDLIYAQSKRFYFENGQFYSEEYSSNNY